MLSAHPTFSHRKNEKENEVLWDTEIIKLMSKNPRILKELYVIKLPKKEKERPMSGTCL